ncbi:unnamed protein product, partial [Sphagnum balticum]
STIQKARRDRDASIEDQLLLITRELEERGIHSHTISKIAGSTASQLVQLLNQGVHSSKEITLVFCYRAATLGMELCLITEDNFQDALQLAERSDDLRKTSQKRNWTLGEEWDEQKHLPPLFGVPVSIKDMFDMAGKRTTIGLAARADNLKSKDCALVAAFKASGMIPFVRTNVPQMAMILETNNFLWGRSLNIWNRDRSVGGSSGGEAGLVAANCSPIGLGNDIGGSLRVPS